ncbi:hypothetical protein C4M76_29555, partial [Escherichia coli]
MLLKYWRQAMNRSAIEFEEQIGVFRPNPQKVSVSIKDNLPGSNLLVPRRKKIKSLPSAKRAMESLR